ETPITVPPCRLAPRAAASGRPGQAPVMTTHCALAAASPSCPAKSSERAGSSLLAPPMIPIFKGIESSLISSVSIEIRFQDILAQHPLRVEERAIQCNGMPHNVD